MNKFDFYEKVIIKTNNKDLLELNGRNATVLAMAGSDGDWHYGLNIEGIEESWSVPEEDLISRGEFAKREDFYDDDPDSRITVIVDKDGNGSIKDE